MTRMREPGGVGSWNVYMYTMCNQVYS